MTRTITLVFLIGVSAAFAGGQTLTTTFNHNNGQSGNMFDLVAINSVTICSFDVSIRPGTYTMEVYVLPLGQSYATAPTTASAWTLLGSASGVVSAATTSTAPGVPTPLPIPIYVSIPAGMTQAFYVTVAPGTGINYTNGTAAGAVFVADANLQFLEGIGVSYPFGGTFSPRVWNGNINYSPGVNNCSATPFQANQANASLDINGVTTNGFNPPVTMSCVGSSLSLNLASALTGSGWEMGIALASVQPSLFTSSNNQVVNVDFLSPTFRYLFGGLSPTFVPFQGNLSIPLSSPFPVVASAQMVVVDPSHPDGVSLSQAAEVQLSAGVVGGIPGPIADNTALTIPLNTSSPLCAPSISFFGVSFTQMHVISNGRVMFGASADTDFSPTLAEALVDSPFCGFWTDLNPAAAGTITVAASSTQVIVDYQGVPYFGSVGSGNSFSIAFDVPTGSVTLGINSIAPNPAGLGGGDAQFLGLSRGNLGASNNGPAGFAIGATGTPVASTDMLYDFWDGLAGTAPGGVNLLSSIQGGLTGILFAPSGDSYTWVGY
jgi:hypothetical protein